MKIVGIVIVGSAATMREAAELALSYGVPVDPESTLSIVQFVTPALATYWVTQEACGRVKDLSFAG